MTIEETTPETVQVFGRYELLSQLAAGGMGEIYLARTRGAGGFEKKVVIKKILPALASEEEFVQKFIDEANIVTHLTHGNIVPVFDMGEVGGEYYLAMEYIAGRDLREVLARCRERGWMIPVHVAMHIVGELCKGLAYAHRKKDADGRDLNIVHRDISPSNVLLSREGEVKIVDFGIAKARGRTSKSITGQLQGKFCYMSPEQATGRSLDARSDIFSTGVLLYECLTNVRPFEGDSDLASLDNVRSMDPPPPSHYRPEITAEVDAIVMRALAKSPDGRFAAVDEMQRSILTWLYANGGMTSQEIVEAFAEVFPEGIERYESRPTGSGARARVSLDDAIADELDKLLAGDSKPPGHTPRRSASDSTATAAPLVAPRLTPVRGEVTMTQTAAPAASTDPGPGQPIRIQVSGDLVKPAEIDAFQRSVTAPFEAVKAPEVAVAPPEPAPLEPAVASPEPAVAVIAEAEDAEPERAAESSAIVAPPPVGRGKGLYAVGAVVLAVIAGLAWAFGVATDAPRGTLIIEPTPTNALVLVDGVGEQVGRTVLSDLKPGAYKIRVSRTPAYSPDILTEVVGPGEEKVVKVNLQVGAAYQMVSFESEPSGLLIELGDGPAGTTPARVPVRREGDKVRLSNHTGVVWEQALIKGGIEATYHVKLEPDLRPLDLPDASATPDADVDADVAASDVPPDAAPQDKPDSEELVLVRAMVSPRGAIVKINGVPHNPGLQLRLKPGVYTLDVEAEGYKPASRTLRVPQERRFFVKLEPLPRVEPDPPAGDPVKIRLSCTDDNRDPYYCRYKVNGAELAECGSLFCQVSLVPGEYTIQATYTTPEVQLAGSRRYQVTARSKADTVVEVRVRSL